MANCHQHSCTCQVGGSSNVHQTLDELEFERGIWSAAQTGDVKRIEQLIAKGTHPNQTDKSGYTALHYAARNGHLEVCKLLCEHGACINATTKAGVATALHRACTAGQFKVTQFLLLKGANVELQDSDGKTALHRAAEKGHMEIFNLLQQYVNISSSIYECKDLKGKRPYDYLDNKIYH